MYEDEANLKIYFLVTALHFTLVLKKLLIDLFFGHLEIIIEFLTN